MSFLQTSFNSEKKNRKSRFCHPVVYKGRHFSRMLEAGGRGGGGGDLFKGRLVGALLLKSFDRSNPV